MDTTYFDNRVPNHTKFDKMIFVNQAGYLPDSEKKAVITVFCKTFQVMNTDGKPCFEGPVSHFGLDKTSGDDIYLADFSAFQTLGTYYIQTDDAHQSLHFSIDSKVYTDVFRATMKAYYFLRCGCALESAYAGPFTHGKCHDKTALLWEDRSVELEVSGGWHDAGDYGRYVTAAACALAHLLYAYKLYPTVFKDFHLHIPESGNGIPDILSECRQELEWILKMQRKDGGVYHKATTQVHAPFVMPEEDTAQMFVFPVCSLDTADFAAVCALASGIYEKYDEAFSKRLLEAAQLSAEWLAKNPEFLGFENPEGCNTGDYSEPTDVDNRFWALAELYAATGMKEYHDALEKASHKVFSKVGLGYHAVGGLGSLAYILCERQVDLKLKKRLENGFLKQAKKLAKVSDSCGYGAAMEESYYIWGSNQVLLKIGMIFAIADMIEKNNNYRKYAERQIHYLLGVNATGYSYVSGTGEFNIQNPHLRPAFADGIEECIPGMVSGGPNRYLMDPDAKLLIPKGTPPMKCFADDMGCYSLNEITIYWNSPAVFLFASLICSKE
ncbi:MAG TPA: glycoside hydrolase family 9 protein [Lachnospiraceae bacterium]|nr:glycoside hydrolase family 9 protein [Lachnospiraceae bacterium]